MKKKNYVEHEVIAQLQRKQDLHIIVEGTSKRIVENRPPESKGDVGIKSRGKISFLVNYCGFFYESKSFKDAKNVGNPKGKNQNEQRRSHKREGQSSGSQKRV